MKILCAILFCVIGMQTYAIHKKINERDALRERLQVLIKTLAKDPAITYCPKDNDANWKISVKCYDEMLYDKPFYEKSDDAIEIHNFRIKRIYMLTPCEMLYDRWPTIIGHCVYYWDKTN